MIDVIIPTIPGREESLDRLLKSLHSHTPDDIEVNEIVIPDSKTCGWGWKQGLELSEAEYVLLACDDQMFANPIWADAAMEAADAGRIVCPRVWLSNGQPESNGGDMKSFAHVSVQPKLDWTIVDYTTVPFLTREAIDQIGMLEVHYASDVWVSYRGKQLGYLTVLRHGFDMVHFQESIGRGAGMSQGERDEVDCAAMYKALETREIIEEPA